MLENDLNINRYVLFLNKIKSYQKVLSKSLQTPDTIFPGNIP